MDILTFFTPAEMVGLDTGADVVVVIDVLRSTTTVTAAFNAGASRVIPTDDIDAAFKHVKTLGIENARLGGVKNNNYIDGFDLGNSPLEYVPEIVEGKALIYYALNLCNSLKVSNGANRVLLGCFNNVQAIVNSLDYSSNVYILCTGKMGRFSFEDSVCAGMFISRILNSFSGEVGLNDASATSRYIYERHHHNILQMLQKSSHGHFLINKHFGDDLEFAARIDTSDIVPELSLDKTHLIPTIALERVC